MEIHYCNLQFVNVVGVSLASHSKPMNLSQYLHDFIEEAQNLQLNGFTVNDAKYEFKIYAFVCDMPAQAFMKCVTGHGVMVDVTSALSMASTYMKSEHFLNVMHI